MTGWHDVVARVRGLSSRLLGRPALEQLAGSSSISMLATNLSGTSYHEASELSDHTPVSLDRAIRRVAGTHLDIIVDWSGKRVGTLAPVFEDEDRRNLRALLRGIAGHATPEQCVAGLLPTPALPFAALEELAKQTSAASVSATLTAWGNAYGRAIRDEASRESPSLFALQFALDREYARRAGAIARRVGEPLLGYVHTIIDAENAHTALACSAGVVEHDVDALFIEGGCVVTRELARVVAAEKPAVARDRLAAAVAGTALAPLAAPATDDTDCAVLSAQLLHLHRVVRLHPLSLEVVIEYVLALRAEVHDLARIVWGIAVQAPRRAIIAGLVTP